MSRGDWQIIVCDRAIDPFPLASSLIFPETPLALKDPMKMNRISNDRPVCLVAAFFVSALFSAGMVGAAVQATGDAAMSTSNTAAASSNEDELAKKLANPVADLISLPFQNNFDTGHGPRGDGYQWKLNIQPVIPIHLNENWNLITRTIIPVISQEDVGGTYLNPSGTQTGLGDVLFTGWFSPVNPTSNGWILGIGPAISLPTGTERLLTSDKWAAGPSVIALKQENGWTYGLLANHLWDFAGENNRASVNNTFIQPFLNLNKQGGWTFGINSESSYNWQAGEWTVPINVFVNKVIPIGKMPTQWQLGGRYYVEKPDSGPDWGLRFSVTLLFPK